MTEHAAKPMQGAPPPVATEPPAALAGPAPVTEPQRIESLDVIRGVAVLGILLMNIDGFALAWAGSVSPLDIGVHSAWDLLTWAALSVFFEGTMRGLFSLLFGAGVILLTSRIQARATPGDAMRIHYRRNLWLLIFGLIHAYVLLWPGDILYIYGLTALFLYPLRKLRPRTLITIAVVVMIGTTVLNVWIRGRVMNLEQQALAARAIQDEGGELESAQEEALREWRGRTVMSVSAMHEQSQAMRSGWWTIATYLAPESARAQTVETGKWALWDAGAFMLIGMALMKLGVMSGARSLWLYVLLLVCGYAVGLTVNVYELVLQWTSEFHPVTVETSFLTYDLGRLAMTLGHLGAIVLFVRCGAFKFLARALAAAGRMALTNYIMQTVICTLIFYGFGLAMFDRLDRSELLLVVVAIWAFQLIVSPIWLRFFRFGPLEWLWRSLTYWKRQPMRRVEPPRRVWEAGAGSAE